MGLVQIDSRTHGPKSMLPLESIPGLVGHSRTTSIPSGENWQDSSRYSEKSCVTATVLQNEQSCVQCEIYNSQHTKSHATFSPSNYSSDKFKICKPYGSCSTYHMENNMSHSLLDYESLDESTPRASYPIYQPTSKQPLSFKCGLLSPLLCLKIKFLKT
ncbi:LOW QUALITY PROTEIN: hypothetical protein Smp_175060 [Schistosoma mansoni]|uniref:hypothetical protein n=1 Tax=Schistosoma mansoni TaxID=6183 RepID=UPI00022DCB68|nr:LOW QUALITY PROTEIN: hypothetical protein Smp_175060 [Schistosoma mansoni]|eukprot:XP_018654187.1 LOW QUALITY PROTEIN: hypothetical protein Smp_175060 [Schistosoma mansoni]